MTTIHYDTPVLQIDGRESTMEQHRGKTLLVVNTASECGFTPQLAGLEELWAAYGENDFAVLGFPCNQFGSQEPGPDDEIATFCAVNYGVTFPMHAKIDVNGSDAHPLFVQLKNGAPGLLGSKAVKWNFTKFLVAADGTVLKRFAPKVEPNDLRSAIESALRRRPAASTPRP